MSTCIFVRAIVCFDAFIFILKNVEIKFGNLVSLYDRVDIPCSPVTRSTLSVS